jgi:diaminohydroxyphosphoribosylaminopyrimidine deaminase/5-amino-6-(5-phosphoribosylamino)uracil reductase
MLGPSDFDMQMMQRAIRVAMKGRGRVEPNPMVGCVVVAKDGRVIGEGFHEKFGGPHAEPNALASVTQSPHGATAYVTLEPCCHVNKKTPPCVPKLIEAKLARVVVGCVDPNPDVNGKGLDLLRAAGIDVIANVLEDEAKQLLAPFIARVVYARPYVTLKWTETADGKVAGTGGHPLAISNAQSTQLVHDLRSRCDSILVGVNTILTDDPLLTARHAEHPRHPARFILDTHLRTPSDARIVTDRSAPTTIFTDHATDGAYRLRRDELQSKDVGITVVPTITPGRLSLRHALKRIFDAFHYDLLVEPGPTLAFAFFEEGLADRVWVIRSPMRANDPTAPAAAPVPGDYVKTCELHFSGDRMSEYLNPASAAFFAATPSADAVLGGGAVQPR